jgi:integral membrane protein (TIGR01906 family)
VQFIKVASRWLFILCVPLVLITGGISIAVNSQWWYDFGFARYNVSRDTGLAPAELNKAAGGLIEYFNSSEQNIHATVIKDGKPFILFNDREVAHLRDVKALFWLGYRVLAATLIYCLGYVALSLFAWKDRRHLALGLFGGGSLTVIVVAALGLGILFDFDQLFLMFHLVSFSNDFWLLDPTSDYLVMLFPQGFWFDTALFCALVTAAGAVILGGLGRLMLKKQAKEA